MAAPFAEAQGRQSHTNQITQAFRSPAAARPAGCKRKEENVNEMNHFAHFNVPAVEKPLIVLEAQAHAKTKALHFSTTPRKLHTD